MKVLVKVVGSVYLAFLAVSAQAASVTVNPWHTAGNGNYTWPTGNYAVSGLVLTGYALSDWGNATITDYTRIYAYGFSDLHGVSYASSPVGDIGMMPLSGNNDGVTLYDFALGAWAGTNTNIAVRIYNGDYSQILSQGSVAVGAAHGIYTANVFSQNGIHIQFSSTATLQNAIDNIRLEGGNPLGISAVPVPAAAWLFGSGLMGLVAVARRRPNR